MKMKNVLKRLLGGGVALALSMAMALGIFVGTGMDVKAEDTWSLGVYTQISSFNDLISGCDPDICSSDEGQIISFIDRSMPAYGIWVVVMFCENDNVWARVHGKDENGRGYYDIISIDSNQYANIYADSLSLLSNYGGCFYIQKNTTPSTSEGTSGGEATSSISSSSSSTTHTHSYSWVTVQEANAGQDGIEEYRCSCGDVQGRSIIPASEVFVKGLYGEIKNAPQNGTATFDSGRLYTISDYVIKKLAERTDVTTVITFEYQNQSYKMTIPAGADFTGLLADEDYFYGYFFFANAVGATIEAL